MLVILVGWLHESVGHLPVLPEMALRLLKIVVLGAIARQGQGQNNSTLTTAGVPTTTTAQTCAAVYSSLSSACSGPVQVLEHEPNPNNLTGQALVAMLVSTINTTFCTSTCPGNLSTVATSCSSGAFLSNWTGNGYDIASSVCGTLQVPSCFNALTSLNQTNGVWNFCTSCSPASTWSNLTNLSCPAPGASTAPGTSPQTSTTPLGTSSTQAGNAVGNSSTAPGTSTAAQTSTASLANAAGNSSAPASSTAGTTPAGAQANPTSTAAGQTCAAVYSSLSSVCTAPITALNNSIPATGTNATLSALMTYISSTFCATSCLGNLTGVSSSCMSLSNWTGNGYNHVLGLCAAMTPSCQNAVSAWPGGNHSNDIPVCNACQPAWTTFAEVFQCPAPVTSTPAATPSPATTAAATPTPAQNCAAWYATAGAACSGPLSTLQAALPQAVTTSTVKTFYGVVQSSFCTTGCPGNLTTAPSSCMTLSNWTANGYNIGSGLCAASDKCTTDLKSLSQTNVGFYDLCGSCNSAWLALMGSDNCRDTQTIQGSIVLTGANVSAILSNPNSTSLFAGIIATATKVPQGWVTVAFSSSGTRRLEAARRLQPSVTVSYNITIPQAQVGAYLTSVQTAVDNAASTTGATNPFLTQIATLCSQIGAGAPTVTITRAVNISPTPAPTPAPAPTPPRASSGTPGISMKHAAALAAALMMIGQ